VTKRTFIAVCLIVSLLFVYTNLKSNSKGHPLTISNGREEKYIGISYQQLQDKITSTETDFYTIILDSNCPRCREFTADLIHSVPFDTTQRYYLDLSTIKQQATKRSFLEELNITQLPSICKFSRDGSLDVIDMKDNLFTSPENTPKKE